MRLQTTSFAFIYEIVCRLTQELDLKARQFDILLRQPLPLLDTPNINLLWARLMIEELCRLGASTFCIAPGTPPYTSFAMEPVAPSSCSLGNLSCKRKVCDR